MEKEKFEEEKLLTLGSVVILKGSTKKIMIISRAIALGVRGNPYYFDYGACFYPEGLINDQLLYFNHEDIMEVLYEGFSDEEEELMQKNIKLFISQSNLEKGNTFELLKKKGD